MAVYNPFMTPFDILGTQMDVEELQQHRRDNLVLPQHGVLAIGQHGSASSLANRSVTTLPPTVGAARVIFESETPITSLSAGANAASGSVVAFVSDGKLYTFAAQSGWTGRSGGASAPLQVGTADDWTDVSCGDGYTLALKSDGSMWSFGSNANGKTGLNTASGTTTTPTRIGTANDWVGIGAGYNSSIARKADGTVYTWGLGTSSGQNLTTGNVLVPTLVSGLSGVTKVGCAGHCLTVLMGGGIYTAGSNSGFATGNGSSSGNTLTFTRIDSANSDYIDINANCLIATNATRAGPIYRFWGGHSGFRYTTPGNIGGYNAREVCHTSFNAAGMLLGPSGEIYSHTQGRDLGVVPYTNTSSAPEYIGTLPTTTKSASGYSACYFYW